ncbi:hypothetical protein J31TS4_10150 [Paenibacillus sp. J31TS4]|uniref:AraC family transcriptional regulator n=1 Tax=Paenibacillus sp. J31TS4 TaxID=2807195 RepID=UPI001B13C5F0|nr:AraC family transcriptional regulator [Paenibacillus sp. J31TS4]GIP37735.1 hypothetical protein J31TS4_10150 [Paenibacillus sp. J31TS4]
MTYPRLLLKQEIVIPAIVSFHYTELTKDYVYPGERHEFWEFLYMDKGEAEIRSGDRTYLLRQGDLVFYTPGDFHTMRANGVVAPNVMIVCFECASPAMAFFQGQSFRLGDPERALLAQLLSEGRTAFDPPVDKPGHTPLRPGKSVRFAAEQMIRLYLELLLIRLIRIHSSPRPGRTRLSTQAREQEDALLAADIAAYLREHPASRPTIAELSRRFLVGATQLKTVFKQETGATITEFHSRLRIEQAKAWMREESFTYTQIAEKLGYGSIHYFSRHFKKCTGMTPSEYDKSLKARVIDEEEEPREWTTKIWPSCP